MKIKKLRLANFKNFEDTEITFGDMNVIVGANASGKSNVLEALRFLRNISDFGLENAISLMGGREYLQNVSIGTTKPTKIEVEYEYSHIWKANDRTTFNSSMQGIYGIELSSDINTDNSFQKNECLDLFTLIKEYDLVSKASKEYKDNFRIKKLNNENAEIFKITDSNEYILTDKITRDSIFRIQLTYSINKPAKWLYYAENYLVENLPVISDFTIYDFDLNKAKEKTSIIGKAELEENGENLALVLKRILDDEEKAGVFSNLMRDVLPFIDKISIDKSFDKSLLFKVKETFHNDSFIPGFLLSDGTISVTAILIALFFEKKPVIAFEEPEQGVHPSLIAKIMQYFYEASQKKQIFITTHSPEVLKHLQHISDLVLVSRNKKGFAELVKPADKEMVKAFLDNDLGIDELFIQNLLDM